MKKNNILMIVENYFPRDPRVRKEAEALKNFYHIYVIALKDKFEKIYEVIDDIHVIRIPELPKVKFKNINFLSRYYEKIYYVLHYFYFTICSSMIFIGSFFLKKYKVVHVHNPPDTLFLIGILGKCFSAKFIFDHHDLSPELFLTKFSGKKGLIHKILVFCEKISCKLADIIISTNNSYKDIVIARHGVDVKKIFVVRNDPIISECYLSKDHTSMKKEDDEFVFLYLGSINPQDGLDVLLQTLHFLRNSLHKKNFICNIIGDGDSLQMIKSIAHEMDLIGHISFEGYISEREKIKEYLNMSDICLEPAPENYLNNHSTFIKIMEYMAAAKPIVAFDLKETRISANGAAILVKPGDTTGYASAIKELMDNKGLREELGKIGYEKVINELNWDRAAASLISAYEQCLNSSH